MAQHDFVFAGFGGQGIMFAGQILAYAAMDAGLNVTWIPSYGPEMRGGTAYCYVVISEQPIGAPLIRHPGIGVIFNGPSFEKFAPLIAPGGLLVYNASLIEQGSVRDDVDQVPVPATAIASDLGDLQLANMVMLGAALASRPVLPLEVIRTALESHTAAHRREKLAGNFAALERGAGIAAGVR